MKNLKTFESFINEAKETPWDKLNRIADEEYAEFGFQTLDTGDMEDLIDMKKANKIASKEYGEFGFTSLDTEDMEDLINRNPKLIKKQYLNEAFNHVLKPYQLRDAGIDKASLPARGDSKFCVVRHDSIIVNGIEVYLNNAIPGAGQGGVTVSIIGLYDTEEEARAAFKNEVKRRTNGTQLSVSMGNLFNRKFGLQFQEIEGHVAKGTVK